MPYKEKKLNKWRGTPIYKGVRGKTKLFDRKKDALEYEKIKKKSMAERFLNLPKGTDLMTFCTKYLDFAERFSEKVYQEKRGVVRRLIKNYGKEKLVADIAIEDVETYLKKQSIDRSANAANKDRKNMMAMWNWAIKRPSLEVNQNPVAITEKLPHERMPQYTPSVEDVLKVLLAADRKTRVYLYAYIFTGARRSEIWRWKWDEDINFERRQYRLGTRKTRDGTMKYEWFIMPDELFNELQWWWENRTIKASPYVFIDDQKGAHYGKPYKARRRLFHGLCKTAKVAYFGHHSLRRFVASRLADMGKTTQQIQRLLRHANHRTTEIYINNINRDLVGLTGGLLNLEERCEEDVQNEKK